MALKQITTVWLLLLFTASSLCGQSLTISGYVKDFTNNEVIIDAVIQTQNQYTTTNAHGYFSLSLKADQPITLTVSHVGFEPQSIKLNPDNDSVINFLMKVHELETLKVIYDQKFKTHKDQLPGAQTIESSDLANASLMLGEADIIKYLALQSGVTTGVEGFAQISVRGGGLYENQYYLDGIPMYNTGHLLGLSSIFNGNIIKKANFYKGHVPSQYGGRLSSFTAIETKNGNSNRWEFNGDFGLIDSDASIEGPLFKKKKSSIIISSRAFYIIPLINELRKEEGAVNYYFYDLNVKANMEIDDKSKIELSYFYGRDHLRTGKYRPPSTVMETKSDLEKQNISNAVLSLRYSNAIDKKSFLTAHLGYTSNKSDIYNGFGFAFDQLSNLTENNFSAQIQDIYARINLDRLLNNNFRWINGVETILHTLAPGQLSTSYLSQFGNEKTQSSNRLTQSNQHLTQISLFSNIDGKLSKNIRSNLGLRITTAISNSTYLRLEPRLAIFYSWKDITFKASANLHHQYLHPLVLGNNERQPMAIWQSTNKNTKPQSSKLLSLGLIKPIFNNKINWSIDGFYKFYNHLISAQNSATGFELFFEPEKYLNYNGRGRAYGIETTAETILGDKIQLHTTYTWTKSFRQFDDVFDGKEFPFKFQREHNIGLNAIYRLSERWSLSSNFVFNSGQRFSFPVAYVENSNLVRNFFLFNQRNNIELPPYHRLDLGAVWNKQINKVYNFAIKFGVYNAYSKKNPIVVYPDVFLEGGEYFAIKGEVLFQALPYINFKIHRLL
ncbi:TonB-dependent receptor [Membranihabitans marinus]|uniref:TonB-dependent receptor n=1 Tax=Membranihabitans marinus TaxID=1227546 RepID=UPI001F429020|nr:carboxypeptidase-like regulatory domain-containing protein [Membranihabitans marinus]